MEALLVLALVSMFVAVALPPLGRMRERAAVRNGRAMVTWALVEARTGATMYQRTSVLSFDPVAGVMRAAIDTSSGVTVADSLVLGRFYLLRDLDVAMHVNRSAVCFGDSGVGAVGPACPLPGAAIVLQRGQVVDTILVNGAGRVWR
jgi:hypothetical protein